MSPSIPITETGIFDVVVVPSPSCPWLFTPQHCADPSLRTAQVEATPVQPTPAEIDTTDLSGLDPSRPETATGTDEFTSELLPSCPQKLPPQHVAEPSSKTAHVCESPLAIETTVFAGVEPSSPYTGVGVLWDTNVPSPNWPIELSPQHTADPSVSTAHVCNPPVAILTSCPLHGSGFLLTSLCAPTRNSYVVAGLSEKNSVESWLVLHSIVPQTVSPTCRV